MLYYILFNHVKVTSSIEDLELKYLNLKLEKICGEHK